MPFLVGALWPIVIPGLMAWLRGLEMSHKKMFLRGFLGGICFVFVSLAWLYALSPVIHGLTSIVFGLYFGVFAAITGRIRRTLGVPLWLIAPAGIVLERISITFWHGG